MSKVIQRGIAGPEFITRSWESRAYILNWKPAKDTSRVEVMGAKLRNSDTGRCHNIQRQKYEVLLELTNQNKGLITLMHKT